MYSLKLKVLVSEKSRAADTHKKTQRFKTDTQFYSLWLNFERAPIQTRSSFPRTLVLPAAAAVAAPGDRESHTSMHVRTPLYFAVAALLRHVKK